MVEVYFAWKDVVQRLKEVVHDPNHKNSYFCLYQPLYNGSEDSQVIEFKMTGMKVKHKSALVGHLSCKKVNIDEYCSLMLKEAN